MPFCDLLNAVFDLLQQTLSLISGIFGITPPDLGLSIGSIMGCNII